MLNYPDTKWLWFLVETIIGQIYLTPNQILD